VKVESKVVEVIKLTIYEDICILRWEWIRALKAWLMEGFERVYSGVGS